MPVVSAAITCSPIFDFEISEPARLPACSIPSRCRLGSSGFCSRSQPSPRSSASSCPACGGFCGAGSTASWRSSTPVSRFPYSANSGFYFVKHNNRTRHFLTSLLMAGDLILKTDSHQQALIATLNEHVSLYGLKAKVLSRDMEEFPGGYQFHQHSKVYMKKFYAGEMKPYIFHMSWTLNKNNKLLFLRQMGEWYVQDQCIQEKASDIHDGEEYNLVSTCCSAEPIFSCHYRDKPSMKPCKHSPPIDKGRPSWW